MLAWGQLIVAWRHQIINWSNVDLIVALGNNELSQGW